MYDIINCEDPVSDDDNELADLTDEELKLIQLDETLDGYYKLRSSVEDQYMLMWENTIVPYLQNACGKGILNKLNTGDGHIFFKYMINNNRIYNELSTEILRLEDIRQKKYTKETHSITNKMNKRKQTVPASTITKIGKKHEEQTTDNIVIPKKINNWNNSSKKLQKIWSSTAL